MDFIYWDQYWAELHRNEMYVYPEHFHVHDNFCAGADFYDIIDAFKELHRIIHSIYDDIAQKPEMMNMPLNKTDEYRFFSKQARISKAETFRYADILYVIGNTGELLQNTLSVDVNTFIAACKSFGSQSPKLASNCGRYISKLTEYGFIVNGIPNGKLPKEGCFQVQYGDNCNLINLIKAMATKAESFNRLRDFRRMHYKLLDEGLMSLHYGNEIDIVLDMLKKQEERETALKLHKEIMSKGFFAVLNGDQMRYYHTESNAKNNASSCFRIVASDIDRTDPQLRFMFRIKNMDQCLNYIENCPQQIQDVFSKGDAGCGKQCGRLSYQFKGKQIYKCGCCAPNFTCNPTVEDIPYYLECFELGN